MILNDIINYFKSLVTVYGKSIEVYLKIIPYYLRMSFKFDYETYRPSYMAVLDEIKKDDINLYNTILKDFKFTFPKTFKKDSTKNDYENFIDFLNSKFLNLPVFNNIDNQTQPLILAPDVLDKLFFDLVSELKDVDCVVDEKNESYEDEFIEKIKEEYDVAGEIEKIKKTYSCPDIENILPPYMFEEKQITKDEVNDVFKECDDEVPNDFTEPNSNDFNNDINLGVDENQPDFKFDNNALDSLIKLYPKECECVKEMLGLVEDLSTISDEYMKKVTEKIDLQKRYSYEKIFLHSLKAIKKNWRNLKITDLSLGNPDDIDLIGDVLGWSKEIKLRTKRKVGKVKVLDFDIVKKEKPSTKDGEFFKVFEATNNELKKEKYKDGSATKEEWEQIDKKNDKEFEKKLNSYIRGLESNGKNVANKILKQLGETNTPNNLKMIGKDGGIGGLLDQEIKDREKTFKGAERDWLEYQKDIDKIKKKMGDQIEKIQDKSNSSKCGNNGNVLSEIKIETEPDDPNDNGDNREIPDPSKPTIYNINYWKRFCKLATLIGLFPIPQFIGNNDLEINFREITNPQIKIPMGSIAIDDDGIPRFLFYPIGLVIPTPFSIDGLWRIPLPTIWKPLFVTVIKSPIEDIKTELLKFQSKISGFKELQKIVDMGGQSSDIFSQLPNGSVLSILSILGLSSLLDFSAIKNPLATLGVDLKTIIGAEVNKVLSEVGDVANADPEQIAQERISALTSQMGAIRAKGQGLLDAELNKVKKEIDDLLPDFDLGSSVSDFMGYVEQINSYINLAESLTSAVSNCGGFKTPSYKQDVDGVLDVIKRNGNELQGLDSGSILGKLPIPKLKIPNLDIGSYLFPILDKLNVGSLSNVGLDLIDELFPDLNKMFSFIENSIMSYVYDIMKYQLWEADFPIGDLLKLKIPPDILANLSVASIDFPELIMVGMIGFSGVIPYPFILLINPTDVDVPGVIKGRTIEFVFTLDLADPIKVVKKNWGSYTLPLKTLIEDYINAGLGLTFDPNSLGANVGIPNAGVKDLYGMIADRVGLTVDELIGVGDDLLKIKIKPKDLYNMFEVPNPNILCKMAKAKSFTDAFEQAKSEVKLDGSLLPPEFSKLESLKKYGVFDLDGKMLVDELKSQYGALDYPKVEDVVSLTTEQKQILLLDKLGISSKAIFDLMPPLTMSSPYIQDDLPPYERLSLKNIPFVIFLIQFLIAGKKGAKLPFLPPEVFPYLDM